MNMNMIAEIDWDTLLRQDHGMVLYVLAGCVTVIIISVTATIAAEWRRVRVVDADARLKELMIQRGYSVEEISCVLSAGTAGRRTDRHKRCGSSASTTT